MLAFLSLCSRIGTEQADGISSLLELEFLALWLKISLLKRDKYNPAYMNIVDTNEHDVIKFIDDYIDDWYKYLNGEKNDISESEKGLKEQIENETPSKRYKRFFNNMDMPDFNHNVKVAKYHQ